MVKGTTGTGFDFEIDETLLDDWAILEQLSEMEDGNLLYAPKFVKSVLGKEQGKALIEHCKEENGRIPTKKVMDEVLDILGKIKEGKN